MAGSSSHVEALVAKVQQQEIELKKLKTELANARIDSRNSTEHVKGPTKDEVNTHRWPLQAEEYRRYGRQMILPEIGLQGQIQIRNASVLLVGVGGLGCPAATYLAGAGVGTIGLMDGDTVETSNLHRQILHATESVGMLKVESAAESLNKLNPNVRYRLHPEHLTPTTALGVFKQYDLVLDCTDHPTSRYLISDAAVLAGIRLVSASALRTEGQLLVLNDPPKLGNNHGGPCYRCIFPKPPSPESVTSCGEGGILGPVVGVMGVLMAVEALKLLARKTTMGSEPHAPQGLQAKVPSHSMLIYSAFSTTPFRTLKLRGKRADCASCSQQPSITEDSLTSGSLDYAVFCGVLSPVSILKPEERTTAEDFAGVKDNAKEHFVLVDVRDETQFGLCNIPESVNIPFLDIERLPDDYEDERTVTTLSPLLDKLHSLPPDAKIYTVCRLGNDSQATARKLKELGLDNNGQRWIGDIKGGFYAWRETVDPSWPRY